MTESGTPTGQQSYPLTKGLIWVLCLVATPFCGSILYYAWRGKHPDAAKYANRVSWVSWIVWIGVYILARRATGQ
jgi:hypothetical protein